MFILRDRPLTPEELREEYISVLGLEWVLELEAKLGHPVR